MEIERKYLLDQLPENLTSYPCKKIEQGYPVSYTHLTLPTTERV